MIRTMVQDPPFLLFKVLCCVGDTTNLRDPMWFMQKKLPTVYANTNSASESLPGFRNCCSRVFLQIHLSCWRAGSVSRKICSKMARCHNEK
jgi:hypothetical protein